MQTFLYIDDDEASLVLIGHIFKFRPNIKLLTSSDPAQGLEMSKIIRPDLIILDIHLPQMDGYAVLKHLQNDEETRNIPVMACSAYATKEDIKKGFDAGFIRYVVKPFKITSFLEIIDTVLLEKH